MAAARRVDASRTRVDRAVPPAQRLPVGYYFATVRSVGVKPMRLVAITSFVFASALQIGVAFAGPLAPHVPEPTSLAIAAVGVGAVALAKFRRRR